MSARKLYKPIQADTTCITVVNYNVHEAHIVPTTEVKDLLTVSRPGYITWISVCGLHEEDKVQQLGTLFNLHPLVIEDILHTHQRPKVDHYDDHLYLTMRMFCHNKGELISEQVSFVLRDNLLISFEELKDSEFVSIRNKILGIPGSIRRKGEDYLLYSLLDYIVDNYQAVLETINDKIDIIEDNIIKQARKSSLQELMDMKRDTLTLRKSISPVREMLINLQRNEIEFFEQENTPFLRDLADHVIRAQESTDTSREILTALMDLYYNQVNNQMNEVMKTLTVISSIFIPLTFIVGVYGMNFENMPELKWHNGYFLVLEGMAVIAIGMLVYFWRKKWF